MPTTLFTLEAVFARHGDALLLHYGPWSDPKMVLIDGGPSGVYTGQLKPRLAELRGQLELDDDEPLPFEMVMVSHIDDDHIRGILDLVAETRDAAQQHRPQPYRIKRLWHNSFDDILGNAGEEIVSQMAATAASSPGPTLPLPRAMSPESKAVVASTAQGRRLRNDAKALGLTVNHPFKGLVMAPAPEKVVLGHGLSLTVAGPVRSRVETFQQRWDKDLKAILKKEKGSAEAASFSDDSPFNLASIVVLAEMKKRKMLLTGDARGDFTLEGLEASGLLKKGGKLPLDVLKVPHHGSDRNVEASFFRRLPARHYVVSGDGEHGNPERATLEMIAQARGTEPYTIHFTTTQDAHKKETDPKRKKALSAVAAWVAQRPATCQVVFRGAGTAARSVWVDLLDPLRPE
jgi:hypothetical protein